MKGETCLGMMIIRRRVTIVAAAFGLWLCTRVLFTFVTPSLFCFAFSLPIYHSFLFGLASFVAVSVSCRCGISYRCVVCHPTFVLYNL